MDNCSPAGWAQGQNQVQGRQRHWAPPEHLQGRVCCEGTGCPKQTEGWYLLEQGLQVIQGSPLPQSFKSSSFAHPSLLFSFLKVPNPSGCSGSHSLGVHGDIPQLPVLLLGAAYAPCQCNASQKAPLSQPKSFWMGRIVIAWKSDWEGRHWGIVGQQGEVLGDRCLASWCVGVTYVLYTGRGQEWGRIVLTVLLQHFPDLPPNEDIPLIVWVPRQGQRTEAGHMPYRVYQWHLQ